MTVNREQAPQVEKLISSLSLEEKISLLAGKNFWETVEIDGKGIPSLKTSDGPNGARGAQFNEGTAAACFPASVSLAATWDLDLARKTGNALAEECMTKGALVLLGPTVCPHRHPLGGRNFESFSEDPLLAGELAAEYVAGLQEKGVGATVKHFAANEQETERFTVNATVSERALREIYLKPFEIVVKKSKPWAVMTSYNILNGDHADSNEFLLKKVLRGQWGWKGLVMSDWGGTNSTAESINAGLDLEMPGPTRRRKFKLVKKAIESGAVSEDTIDDRCRNIIELLIKTRKFENPQTPDEKAVNKPEHQALIRNVGRSGIVLLKNEGNLLPLKKEELKGKTVAVVGLAKTGLIHGGGSAAVNSHYRISPWEGLSKAFGDSVDLKYAKGAHIFRLLPPMETGVVNDDGKPGFTLEKTFSTDSESVPWPKGTWTPIGDLRQSETVKLRGTFTPAQSGSHYLGCSGLGPTRLYINDELVMDQKANHKDFMGFLLGCGEENTFQYAFEAGKQYKLLLTSTKPSSDGTTFSLLEGILGFHLGFMLQSTHDEDVLSHAISLAKTSDIVIVCTGHTPDWETEGQDRQSFHLPANGSQDRLITAVAKVNRNVVVVNSTGSAVAMPWLPDVSALVQAWFPGQEAGNAIADVLLGVVNPSGRLPVSFPRHIEDAPAYSNFPGEVRDGRLEVEYAEGIFIGYRHYDREDPSKLLFPFGFGLSYTEFEMSGLTVESRGAEFRVRIQVTNSGKVAGAQVVQVYAGPAFKTEVEVPVKQLVGFAKVVLEPGKTEEVGVDVSVQKLAYFSEGAGEWVVEKGRYRVFVGASVVDIVAEGEVEVEKRVVFAA